MMNMDNYKRSIAWLKRHMDEYALDGDNAVVCDGMLHSAEVTYEVTESVLRRALNELTGDQDAIYVSSRELMRLAQQEGLEVAPSDTWLRYGLALEAEHLSMVDSSPTDLLSMLPEYVRQLEDFSKRLEKRLVSVA